VDVKGGVDGGDEAAVEHVVEGEEGGGGDDDEGVLDDVEHEAEVVGVEGELEKVAEGGGDGADGETEGPAVRVLVDVVGEEDAEDGEEDARDEVARETGLVREDAASARGGGLGEHRVGEEEEGGEEEEERHR